MDETQCLWSRSSQCAWGQKQRGWVSAGSDTGKGLHKRQSSGPRWAESSFWRHRVGWNPKGLEPQWEGYPTQWIRVGHMAALRTRIRQPSNRVSAVYGYRGGESKDLKITPNWPDRKVLRTSKEPGEKPCWLWFPGTSCSVSNPGINAHHMASVPRIT